MKAKRALPSPARDLYTSALFRGLRRYAEEHADEWFILSAEHGLLAPGEVVAPYEKTLSEMPKADRVSWARRVERQLEGLVPAHAEVLLLVGARYREGIEGFLTARGNRVSVPLRGLGIGRQLQFLARQVP